MFENYYPYEYAPSVFAIDYNKLFHMGYRGIIFDIDNTLVHHGDDSNDKVDQLFRELHSIGFRTLLLTNNDRERTERFLKNIESDYIADANKPYIDGYIRSIEKLKLKKEEIICIGDQIFTDILGANKCGIPNILVKFICVKGLTKIGKQRWVEYIILYTIFRLRSKKHRIGNILKTGV